MASLRMSAFQAGTKSALLVKEKHCFGNHRVPIVWNRNSTLSSHRLRVVANPDFTETGALIRSNQANLSMPWESFLTNDSEADEKEITSQRLDQWLRESVTEIVSNIGEAPFLMQIHTNERGNPSPIGTVIEKAMPNGWPEIKKRWKNGRCPKPNGVILVKEIESGSCGEDKLKKKKNSSNNGDGQSSTKVWGILIQGRGMTNSACYVLKTCRVQSTFGFCTHFCVFKMDSFQESIETQLRNLWLV